jgi:putative FmdB family regulatory protein
MPIYCYKCEKCGNEWESFTHSSSNQDKECPQCGDASICRNYAVETKVVSSDIKPYFDFGIGEYVSGRRDRLTKYKARGFVPLHGADFGDSVKPFRRYYDDEKVHELYISKKDPIDFKLDQALKMSIEASGKGSEADAVT